MSPEYLVISASLRAASISRALAQVLVEQLDAQYVDLREFPLPLCDGGAAYADPNVEILRGKIQAARVILLCVPIYNFDANAAAKNLVELTGGAWEDKIVGFACAAGAQSSYMSIMALANSLMLDFRCIILPRFVYATSDDADEAHVPNAAITQRLHQLAQAARSLRNGA